jgi:hypothetical protein
LGKPVGKADVARGETATIAFATFRGEPGGAADDRIAAAVLAERHIRVEWPPWDDLSVDWARYRLVLPRSTWDYHRRCEEFLRWAERVDRTTELLNPLALIRWNAHKSYLAELEKAGVGVVPTELVRGDEPEGLESVLRRRGWKRVVVKPAIGADNDRLWIGNDEKGPEGERHLQELLHIGDALVQPYLPRAVELGERSLVFFAGEYSHACAYRAVSLERPRQVRPFDPPFEAIGAARRIVERYAPDALYARLDYLPAEGDRWLLGELELIEPELLFRGTEVGSRRFADAIEARMAVGRARTD